MNSEQEKIERNRFLVLNLVRISGAAMLAFGLAVIARGFLDLPKEVGYVLFVAGALEFIVAPLVLANAWKSRPDL